jgi:hypothetical protein
MDDPRYDERRDPMLAVFGRDAAARFFIRCGQAGRAAKRYDEVSRPLFPLWLLMECEGMPAHVRP